MLAIDPNVLPSCRIPLLPGKFGDAVRKDNIGKGRVIRFRRCGISIEQSAESPVTIEGKYTAGRAHLGALRNFNYPVADQRRYGCKRSSPQRTGLNKFSARNLAPLGGIPIHRILVSGPTAFARTLPRRITSAGSAFGRAGGLTENEASLIFIICLRLGFLNFFEQRPKRKTGKLARRESNRSQRRLGEPADRQIVEAD